MPKIKINSFPFALRRLLTRPVVGLSVAILASSAFSLPAYACQLPKSYYKNVSCTADRQYFLATKDSGAPVALIDGQGKAVIDLMSYSQVAADKLQGGVLPVRRGQRIGYINMAGQEVVPLIYDVMGTTDSNWARAAYDNRIIVKKNGQLGIINTSNQIILPFASGYDRIDDYKNGRAQVQAGNQNYALDRAGNRIHVAATTARPITEAVAPYSKTIEPSPYAQQPVVSSPPPPVVSVNRTIRAQQTPSNVSVYQNPAVYQDPSIALNSPSVEPNVPSQKSSLTQTTPTTQSLIETQRIIEKPHSAESASVIIQNTSLSPYQDTSQNTAVWQAERRDGLWGFINNSGTPMITFSFKEVTPFSEGLAGVRMDDTWGFVSLAGDLVIPFQFSHQALAPPPADGRAPYRGVPPFTFINGKAWVGTLSNGERQCIDTTGQNVTC